MAGAAGWPEATNPQQYLRQLDRRITIQERRAAATSAADLVGPGIAARAIQLYDWNDASATFNGFYYSMIGARHAPETGFEWNGTVTARADGSGTQHLVNPQGTAENLSYVRTFKQHPDDAEVVLWGAWKKFATHSGFIDYEELNPDTVVPDIEAALADAAEAIEFTEAAIRVFRQDAAPVPGVGDAPAVFKEGWIWFDTNDSNHMRIWKTATSTWVEPDYGMTTAQAAALATAASNATTALSTAGTAFTQAVSATADAAAAYALASDALSDASDAFDLAAAKTKVYRQAADPDIVETINTGDVWFETDNENRMWIWSSGAWIDPASLLVNTIVRAPANAGTGTSPTVVPGIALAPAGLSLWNNLGTTVFLNGTTGAALFKGSITSGSDIAGTTITGGTVQSEVTAARGVKMTSTGLIGYDGAGVATFTLLANGTLTLKGSIVSGSDITGATITGGLIQSEATSSRGIKLNSTALIAYNPSGVATLTITASSGDIAMRGELISGSTITAATITGTLQTEVTALRGIKLTSAGLSAYNTSGTLTAQFLSATGTFYALGGLISGGDVAGATVTGGTLQTDAAASTGIKISSAGLIGYGSGVAKFVLSATTGDLTLNGSVISGGTIDGTTITGSVLQTGTSGDRIVISNSVAAQVQMVFGAGGTAGGIGIVSGPTVQISSGIPSGANVSSSIGLAGNASGIIGDITMNGVTNFNYGILFGNLTYIPDTATNSNPWKAMMCSDGGLVRRFSSYSSRRYKKEISTLDGLGAAVLGIEPVRFRYKMTAPIDQAGRNERHRGVVAEDLHEAGLTDWLRYDEQGRPDEVDNTTWAFAVHAAVRYVNKKFEKKIESLEARLATAGI